MGRQRAVRAKRVRATSRYGRGRVFRRTYRDQDGVPRLTNTWSIAYYQNGRECRESLGTSDEAEALATLQLRLQGVMPATVASRKSTFEDLEKGLLGYYRENKLAELETAERCRLPALRRFFVDEKGVGPKTRRTGILLRAIDMNAVKEYRRWRLKDGVSNATVNREVSTLRKGLKLAAEDGLIEVVPTMPEKLREGQARQGFFEQADLEKILAHIPAHLKNLVRTWYITGWRHRELLQLTWAQHIDFDGKEMRLYAGEGKDKTTGRVFPLLPQLQRILEDQRALVDAMAKERKKRIPWVFPGRLGERIRGANGIQHPWSRACEAAGVDRLVHDFRRTAVRNLVRAGVPRKTAMEMVGHKTEEMFRRYNIVDYKDVQDAGEKLSAFLADVP